MAKETSETKKSQESSSGDAPTVENIKTDLISQKESPKDSCCYKKDYLDFYAKLIWPVFILLLLIIFRKYVFKILDLFVELIPKIRQLNAAGVEISFKDTESYVLEFVQDVAESREDQQENPTPYNDLNEAYKASQEQNAKNSMMALAKMKAEIILFEELAIKSLSQIVKKDIVAGKTLSLSGRKLSADGYFSFEGTFWLIEVKMLKNMDARSITKFIEMIGKLDTRKAELSSISNMTIGEVRGVLIIPNNIEIKPIAKTLILSHRLVVYELDKGTGILNNIFNGN